MHADGWLVLTLMEDDPMIHHDLKSRASKIDLLDELMSRSETRRKVVALLVQGFQRKQIAKILQRSQHTIDWHIKRLYTKLGIHDRVTLVLLAGRLFDSKGVE